MLSSYILNIILVNDVFDTALAGTSIFHIDIVKIFSSIKRNFYKIIIRFAIIFSATDTFLSFDVITQTVYLPCKVVQDRVYDEINEWDEIFLKSDRYYYDCW